MSTSGVTPSGPTDAAAMAEEAKNDVLNDIILSFATEEFITPSWILEDEYSDSN